MDETFAAEGVDHAARFLSQLALIAPVASVSCLVRHVSLMPAVSASSGYGGCAAVATGFWEVTTQALGQRLLDTAEGFQVGLTQIMNHPKVTGGPVDLFREPVTLRQLGQRYDAIVCLSAGVANRQRFDDELACRLVRMARTPIWCVGESTELIRRVVVIECNERSAQRLSFAARRMAAAWNASLTVLFTGGRRQQPAERCAAAYSAPGGARPSIVTCTNAQQIPAHLKDGDFVVMATDNRSWLARLLSRSPLEAVLRGLRVPALVLPGRASLNMFASPSSTESVDSALAALGG